jgi:hypothetical protein
MEIKEGEYYLVNTDGWWYAPDGIQYKAIWGKASIIKTEEALGFTPIRPSTNWFICIGNMIIAGCQIHYLMKCPNKPSILCNTWMDNGNELGKIYINE